MDMRAQPDRHFRWWDRYLAALPDALTEHAREWAFERVGRHAVERGIAVESPGGARRGEAGDLPQADRLDQIPPEVTVAEAVPGGNRKPSQSKPSISTMWQTRVACCHVEATRRHG